MEPFTRRGSVPRETDLKDPPLPVHLDDLFLPRFDLDFDLFRLRFELVIPDQPGVRAVRAQEGQVVVPIRCE